MKKKPLNYEYPHTTILKKKVYSTMPWITHFHGYSHYKGKKIIL